MKRRSWEFQNTPNLQSLDDFEPSYGTSKKDLFVFKNLLNKTRILGNFYFSLSAIT